MNKIYKTVWNALRHCLVVVNETTKSLGGQSSGSGRQQGSICAQTPARHGIQSKKCFLSRLTLLTTAFLLAFSPLSVSAKNYEHELGKDYVYGDLNDIDRFYASGANSIIINSINSPSAYIEIRNDNKPEAIPDPESGKYHIDDVYVTDVTVNQDIVGGYMYIVGNVNLNGNITAVGNQSTDWYIEQVEEAIANKTNPGSFLGQVTLGGNEIRPVIVKGNVTAPVFHSGSQSFYKGDPSSEYWGYVHVMGDVKVDILFTDNIYMYDDMTDFLRVDGTAEVSSLFFNNGSSDINKLIVKGTFYNGFGHYGGDGINNPSEQVGATIGELDAVNIVNGSNLYVDTLTNTREQTYTQTFGTIQVKNNWFTNSTINMSGGIINEASLGPDKNLGINNVFNVSGGRLVVDDLNFDSQVNLSGSGKIETDIVSIFINPDGDPEALNYVGLNASEPESVKASLTKWFTNYVPGTLRTDLEDHVNFNGGSIVVSGFGKITETQYDDLMKAFKEAFLNSIRKDLFQA